MDAQIVCRSQKDFTIQFKIPYANTMLDFEEKIQGRLNEAGIVATGEALSRFDTDGAPIFIGGKKWTSKGKIPKPYQTPYGEVIVDRHVYQSSAGGRHFCPLERDARIVITSTPKFAKMVSSKYSGSGSASVAKDLEENHGRTVAKSYVQNVCDAVGSVAMAKEENWSYELPEIEKAVNSISLGLDGTCMLMTEEGYRQAMVGTIGFFDEEGERLHTIYTAAAPEYGKATFLSRFENEIRRVKARYPCVQFIGLADGARDNWEFLKKHTDVQTVDFFHATGYLGKAASVMFKGKRNLSAKEDWLNDACHNLKHKHGVAGRLLREMETFSLNNQLSGQDKEQIDSSISYFRNNKKKMKYAQNMANNLPIGSGITESACKVIVKQRLCCSGMKWKDKGAAIVLSLRCLNQTKDRWTQFWEKINQYGFSIVR
jgi:hypothetical protein